MLTDKLFVWARIEYWLSLLKCFIYRSKSFHSSLSEIPLFNFYFWFIDSMISNLKVVITDYDYGDLEIEKGILNGVGAEEIPVQAKCEEDLFEVAEDCFGMINQ